MKSLILLTLSSMLLHMPDVVASQGFEVLGLRQSITLALENSHKVRIRSSETESARQEVIAHKGLFDPVLTIGLYASRDSADMFQDEAVYQYAKIEGSLPTGTNYYISATTAREYVESTNPAYATIGMGIRQKMLNGAGISVNWAPIRIASLDHSISTEQFILELSIVVTEVQFAYFDVILAEQQALVARQSMELAQRLYDDNLRREQLMALAGSDLFQAQYELAARKENLYEAERRLGDARNALRLFITNDPILSTTMQLHLEELPSPEEIAPDTSSDYQVALHHRPDYRQAIHGLSISQIESLRASNNTLPMLELYMNASFSARGKNIADSLSNAKSESMPDYVAGLSLSRPVTNRTALAENRIATERIKRSEITLRQLEQLIAVQLDNASRRITMGWKGLQLARESSALAIKSLASEQKRFEAGASSTFIILSMQTDLMNARLRQLSAENNYRKAIVDYRRIMGCTLTDMNILTYE